MKISKTMKNLKVLSFLFLLLMGSFVVSAQSSVELDKASKSGKAVFLVAYSAPGAELDKAVSIASTARLKVPNSAVVVKLNTSDAGNAALVSKYKLTGAPLPLVLVLDKNGTSAGGFLLKDATAEKLVGAIPSPKLSEILLAISGGKSAYVVLYKESMTSKKNIMDNCAIACTKMANKSVVVTVNAEDNKEANLLKTLKYNTGATEPVTYVINSAGQIAGTFTGTTDVNNLIATAKKAPASGCCPSGAPAGGCK